jgi:Kef-type K+ transport system membrane component KefB
MFLAETVFEAESFLLTVLVQLILIIAAARVGGWLLARAGQPQVVGEIAAGILLGPSAFGRLFPDVFQGVFPAEVKPVFDVLGQLGLMFLMFLVGLEFDFAHLRRLGRAAGAVAIGGVAAPFAIGLLLGHLIYPSVDEGGALNAVAFTLFLATALSITAIPVLGRILIELKIHRTQVGLLTISAAAVDDALGWILLAAVSAIVRGQFQVSEVLRMLLLSLAFVAAMAGVLRPLARRWIPWSLARGEGQLGLISFSLVFLAVLGSAVLTNLIGIFSIFGPFVLGAALCDQNAFKAAVTPKLREFVTVFFLPIFFTYTGLGTDVRLIDSGWLWFLCVLVTLGACAGKMLGCGLAARWSGLPWRESGCVAILMNTRALMGLIAIHVGREMGAIPESVFCMLVFMALLTTFIASPLVRLLMRGAPLAEAGAPPAPAAAAPAGRAWSGGRRGAPGGGEPPERDREL